MLKIILTLTLAAMAIATVPSYIPVCGRRNPDLDNCVMNSIEALRGKLREGMPELETPAIEPFAIEQVKLVDQENFKVRAQNVQLYGFPDFVVKSLHVDLEKQQIDGDIVFDQIKLTADYDVSAKLLVPISGRGPFSVVIDGVKVKFNLKFKLVNNKGQKYVFFPSMTIKLLIEDYTAHYEPRGIDADTLATAINTAFQGGRQEIINLITPNLENTISKEFLSLANNICKHFTYEEMLPDRE